jgi:hypothetical protein
MKKRVAPVPDPVILVPEDTPQRKTGLEHGCSTHSHHDVIFTDFVQDTAELSSNSPATAPSEGVGPAEISKIGDADVEIGGPSVRA